MAQDDSYRSWVGKTDSAVDFVDESRVERMYATLDVSPPPSLVGSVVPILWHWMFFAPVANFSDLGEDGHPKRGGFLPPVNLPRRMWAGGRLVFHKDLLVGTRVCRESTIKDIVLKEGRTGSMVFVTVAHVISDEDGVILEEEHDIVYRDNEKIGAPSPRYKEARQTSDFSNSVTPDPVTLFRYSALTFNGHRIHYDRKYCLEQEGYPGLVFHGPLTATYLSKLLTDKRSGVKISTFSFRAVKPIFDNHSFDVHGERVGDDVYNLWTRDHAGHITMEASVTCVNK